MTTTESTAPQYCTAFSAQLAVVEAARRSRPVLLLLEGQEGQEASSQRAKLRIGAASAAIEFRLPGQKKAAVKHLNLIPTVSLDASRLGQGILRITGAWPTSSVCLKFSGEPEARRVQEELEAVAASVVQSLHLQVTPHTPLLTACPLPGAGPLDRQPAERGAFHLAGYALWDDLAVNREPQGSPRRFRLYWVELCGPLYGMTALYFYSSHCVEGKLMNYTVLNRGGFSLVGNQVKVHGQEPLGGVMYAFEAQLVRIDETLTFRSVEEAALWFDVASAVVNPDGNAHEEPAARVAGRVEEVVAEMRRQARDALGAPLLADASYSLAPKPLGPLPTDAVAMHTRKKQEVRMQALADAFACDEEEEEGPEAAYDSFGTTVFQ